MAKRGGYRSVPNFVATLLCSIVYTASETQAAWREEARRTPAPEEEVAEMFNEYTNACAPQYGQRTKRTRRHEPKP